ncbi:unnamed protein product, partial [Adineta ricciae]
MVSLNTTISDAMIIKENTLMFIRVWCYTMIELGSVGHASSVYMFTRPPFRSNPCTWYFLASTISGSRLPNAWFIALACIDRFSCSSSVATLCALSNIRVVCRSVPLVIFHNWCCLYIPVPILYQINVRQHTCVPSIEISQTFFSTWNLIVYSIDPPIVMAYFGAHTVQNTRHSVRRVKQHCVPMHNPQQHHIATDRQLIQMMLLQCVIFTVSFLKSMGRNDKRQQPSHDNIYCKKQKLRATTLDKTKCIVTQFEDLSNEVICDIFEYLNAYHIYESFLNLNTRFQNLLKHLPIPLIINIPSFLSKSIFQQYYTDFIQPNIYQTQSFYAVNPFITNFFLSTTENFAQCSQLQTLILDEMPTEQLENLLISLSSLPKFSSLTMHVMDDTHRNNICNLIFQLPKLKFCKIFFAETIRLAYLSICISSPIEHLVLTGTFYL